MTGPATGPSGFAPPSPRCYRHPDREALVRCTRCDRPICPSCMLEAPVGFHCPEDAAEARRTQRVPRNTIGATLRRSPPWVTAALFALNVGAYLATALPSPQGINSPESSRLFQDWQLFPYAIDAQHQYFRLVTSGFLHAGLLHIATNMISLLFIGPALEQMLGRWRFVSVYAISLLGGSATVYAFGAPLVPVVGASGALFGLLGACLVLVRRLGLDLQWLIAILVLNFALTFSVAEISKLAHIGGFVTGALAGLALGGRPNSTARLAPRVQAAGLGTLLAVVVVLVAVRAAAGTQF